MSQELLSYEDLYPDSGPPKYFQERANNEFFMPLKISSDANIISDYIQICNILADIIAI